LKFNR